MGVPPVVVGVGWFVVEGLSAYALSKALDKLASKIEEMAGFRPPTDGATNDQLIAAYKAGIPNTYKRYGVLFEAYWITDAKGDYILIPRGYGQTPAHAIVNEKTIFMEAPELSDEVAKDVALRKQKINNEALKRGYPLDRQGVWLEYNPVDRSWSTEAVNIQQAEATAELQIKAQVVLNELAATSVGLEKIRAQAIAWNNFYDQYNVELSAQKIDKVVGELVRTNEETAKKIESAIESMRESQASAGFYQFLGALSLAMDIGAVCIGNSDAGMENAEVRAEYYRETVIQLGDDVYHIQQELKEKVYPTIKGPVVYPEVMTKGWVEPYTGTKKP